MDDFKKFRKQVMELLASDDVNGKIKPSLNQLVQCLMQVEFVAYCIADDGEDVFLHKDSAA